MIWCRAWGNRYGKNVAIRLSTIISGCNYNFCGCEICLKFGTDEEKWKLLHPYLSSLPLSQLLLSIILDTRVTVSEKVQSNAIVFRRPLPYHSGAYLANKPIWFKVLWLSVYCLHSIHTKFKADQSDGSRDTSFHYYISLFAETPALLICRIFRRASLPLGVLY